MIALSDRWMLSWDSRCLISVALIVKFFAYFWIKWKPLFVLHTIGERAVRKGCDLNTRYALIIHSGPLNL